MASSAMRDLMEMAASTAAEHSTTTNVLTPPGDGLPHESTTPTLGPSQGRIVCDNPTTEHTLTATSCSRLDFTLVNGWTAPAPASCGLGQARNVVFPWEGTTAVATTTSTTSRLSPPLDNALPLRPASAFSSSAIREDEILPGEEAAAVNTLAAITKNSVPTFDKALSPSPASASTSSTLLENDILPKERRIAVGTITTTNTTNAHAGANGPQREAFRSVPAPPHNSTSLPPLRGQRGPDPLTRLRNAGLQDLRSMCIKLSRLPKDITTREIYESLTEYGLSIARIDIGENHVGMRNGYAWVDIEPTPSRWPPWRGRPDQCSIRRNDPQALPLRIEVQVAKTERWDTTMLTPLGHVVPRQFSFECRSMLLGLMARKDAMYQLPQYEYRDVRIEFQFYRRFVQITFNVDLGERLGTVFYKIPIKFTHITKMTHVKKEDNGYAVIVQLPSPPELFSKMADFRSAHDDGLSIWQDRDMWERQVEITHQPHRAKTHPAQLTKNRKTVDLAQWTTYYLNMPSTDMADLIECGARLGDYNVSIDSEENFDIVEPGQSVWDLLNNPESDNNLGWFNTIHLPFEVRYQLEVCISQGLFKEYSIGQEFLTKLVSYDAGSASGFDRARMMLEGVADLNVQYYRPIEMFEDFRILHYWPTCKVPPQAAMVRRAVVTPTGIYFKTPGVELTNRVLRRYSDLTDRFLRVQFTDELSFGGLRSSQGSKTLDWLYTRVLRVLLNGIVIGDRHYRVLAWSNSQFREHGAFFFCGNSHVDCEDIRDWMGDLKHIRSVGKFAARMGQCFTTTRQLSGVSVPQIVEMKDIERETDGKVWNFTDGIGKISPFLAQMITHEQDMLLQPSGFQFRMGGCKGMLVVWDDVAANEVHIRPSQEKFKAPYNGLEIIKVSSYSQGTLNRQIIPILSCLGVANEVFMELLEEELQQYESAMTEPWRASALLRQRVDENQTALVLADMVDTFMAQQEPFLWTILRLWRCWALQRLKYKAAISVKKSAFLYGCVDELGVLRGHSKDTEGKGVQDQASLPQIFLQVPQEGRDPNNLLNYHVVTGLCVVGRNPSLHPGDIRVVEAVDHPGLRHLKNVVVFPQTGDRDVPSMCSGGDLDGDDFFVFWDERLLPQEWDYPPMDHDAESSGRGVIRNRDIHIGDMCAFFADYIKNDCVGIVANSHFAWADKITPKGAKCIELAKLHSRAVDYIKSGVPAIMHRSLRCKNSPHWMERKHGKSFRSPTPVGRIYDAVHMEQFNPAYNMPFDSRILSAYQSTAEELTMAKDVKGRYDIAMRRLMGQHERPISEFEIWSTFVLSKPRVGTDYKMQEEIGRNVGGLKNRFRMQCCEAISGVKQKSVLFSSSGMDPSKLDRFVAAMYRVTHEEVQEALEARALPVLDEEGNKMADDQGPDFPMPLISFPWLFHKELARIANGGVAPVLWQPKQVKVPEAATFEGDAKLMQNVLDNKVLETQQVRDKKEGELRVVPNGTGVPEDADIVRIASGKMVRRGEMLELFGTQGEAVHGGTVPVEEGQASAVGLENGVPKLAITGSSLAAVTDQDPTWAMGAKVDVQEGVEEEDSEDEDSEDLEDLARKLAAGGVGCE